MQVFVDDQPGEQHDAEHLQDADPDGIAAVLATRIDIPDQEESGDGEQREDLVREPAFHAAHIHGEHAHHDEGQRTEKKMTKYLELGIAFAVASADGEGDGEAHAEDEGREDQVGEAEHVFIGCSVMEPVGESAHAGEVVHEKHREHRQGAEDIDGSDSFHGRASLLDFVAVVAGRQAACPFTFF